MKTPSGRMQAKGVGEQIEPLRLGFHEQRQARDDGGGRLARAGLGERAEGIGVALDDIDAGKALLEQLAEIGIEFDQEQALRGDAALQQRLASWSPFPGPSSMTGPGACGST